MGVVCQPVRLVQHIDNPLQGLLTLGSPARCLADPAGQGALHRPRVGAQFGGPGASPEHRAQCDSRVGRCRVAGHDGRQHTQRGGLGPSPLECEPQEHRRSLARTLRQPFGDAPAFGLRQRGEALGTARCTGPGQQRVDVHRRPALEEALKPEPHPDQRTHRRVQGEYGAVLRPAALRRIGLGVDQRGRQPQPWIAPHARVEVGGAEELLDDIGLVYGDDLRAHHLTQQIETDPVPRHIRGDHQQVRVLGGQMGLPSIGEAEYRGGMGDSDLAPCPVADRHAEFFGPIHRVFPVHQQQPAGPWYGSAGW